MPEDFEELLEESLKDPDMKGFLEEKVVGEEVDQQSVGEMVKDYPGPQREIDLHGQTGSEAMFELRNFIERSVNQRIRTVRVITGKGLHSQHMKSVLPELTEKKLGELRRTGKVLTFRREKTGGSYLVYLVS
jgi:DNA-nicking Smr family endonuclease